MVEGVRDRSREILREQFAEAAAEFCAERGFEDVTADDIAHGIGVSRATFFRYFGSKEDAVVAAFRSGRFSVSDRLRGQPRIAGESALLAVRRAVQPVVEDTRARPEQLRARIAMIGATPALRARLASDRAEQRSALADALVDLVGDRAAALAVAGVAAAAIDLGWSLWLAEAGSDPADGFDRAFDLVATAQTITVADS